MAPVAGASGATYAGGGEASGSTTEGVRSGSTTKRGGEGVTALSKSGSRAPAAPPQQREHEHEREQPDQRGRAVRPDLKLGICGEHGGDPASVAFFEGAGLDYVSCSPYRVPIARLAAAQAALGVRAASSA